jgi:hypothetical protein
VVKVAGLSRTSARSASIAATDNRQICDGDLIRWQASEAGLDGSNDFVPTRKAKRKQGRRSCTADPSSVAHVNPAELLRQFQNDWAQPLGNIGNHACPRSSDAELSRSINPNCFSSEIRSLNLLARNRP